MATGSYAQRIQAARPNLSKSFQRLADYILDSYVQAALMTASELAHEVDVDSATVVRFAQALNYSGFPELQVEIKARVIQDLALGPREGAAPDSLSGVTDVTLKELSEAIDRRRRLMDAAPLAALLDALDVAGRVLILADAQGQSLAPELRRLLLSVGIATMTMLADESSLALGLAAAGPQDFLLAIDLRDETPLIPAALAQAKTAGLKTGAIAGSASFAAAQRAGIVIEVQSQEQSDHGMVVLAAIIHVIGQALHWRFAEQYKQLQTKEAKTLKRLAAAGSGKA